MIGTAQLPWHARSTIAGTPAPGLVDLAPLAR